MIEHPIRPRWRLVAPKESTVERTATHYRLTRVFEAGESAIIEVVAERPIDEAIRLISLDDRRVGGFIRSRELSAGIRDAFRRMLVLKKAVDKAGREVKRLDGRLAEISKGQKRIRDNLARVPRGSGLANRYLRKLDAQEDEIEKRQGQLETARDAQEAARAELAKYVGGLAL